MHACTHVCVSVSIWGLVFVCIYLRKCAVCLYVHLYACVHAFVQECACLYVCMCVQGICVATILLKGPEGLFCSCLYVPMTVYGVFVFACIPEYQQQLILCVFFHISNKNSTKVVLLFKGICTGLVCMCMHPFVYARVLICLCMHVYASVCASISMCMHVHASACMCVSTFISTAHIQYILIPCDVAPTNINNMYSNLTRSEGTLPHI